MQRFYCMLLLCLSLTGCLYIYPIPYPIESEAYYECVDRITAADRLFALATLHNPKPTPRIKQANDYLSEARVDQALENYLGCVVLAERTLEVLTPQR